MSPRVDDRADATESTTVELRLFASFRDAVGEKTVTVEYPAPVTVGGVLAALEASFPALAGTLLDDAGGLHSAVSVVRNGRNVVHHDGLETVLADGDALGIMPPLSGGSTHAAEPATLEGAATIARSATPSGRRRRR